MTATTRPDFRVSASVVIPYLSRKSQLDQAIAYWLQQDYTGHLGVIVVDFSGAPSDVDLKKVKLVRSQNLRWNINRARNLGARESLGDLLIFSPTDALPVPDFVSSLASHWDDCDLWVAEQIYRDLPSDPALAGLLAVKRWVHTRLRGFNEPLMESPHGWGYDAIDFRLRAQTMLSSCGGVVGYYPSDAAIMLPNTDEERAEPYEVKNLEDSLNRHIHYSLGCRAQHGWVANVGQDWGQST